MKKVSIAVVLLALLAGVAIVWISWNGWVHHFIDQQLAKKNIVAEFTVTDAFPGTLLLNNIRVQGSQVTADSLEIHYSWRELLSKRVAVDSAILRLQNSEVSLEPFKYDIFRPSTVDVGVSLKNIPIDDLLKLLTNGRASATGALSGAVPVTVHEDGSITVQNTKLATGQPGILRLDGSLIPGDNEQLALVRKALAEFHYQQFSLAMENTPDKKLSILLQLHGNNPDVYNGREVDLNVRLNGDLLALFQQNIMSITDPKQFLEQH